MSSIIPEPQENNTMRMLGCFPLHSMNDRAIKEGSHESRPSILKAVNIMNLHNILPSSSDFHPSICRQPFESFWGKVRKTTFCKKGFSGDSLRS